MAKIRIHMAVTDGQFNAIKNRTNTPLFDKRGGWAGNFSIDLRRADDPDAGWNGASWVMYDTIASSIAAEGEEAINWERFQSDVIALVRHNTGAPNVGFVSAVHETEYPGLSPRAGFDALLADTVKKPWALERVPAEPPLP